MEDNWGAQLLMLIVCRFVKNAEMNFVNAGKHRADCSLKQTPRLQETPLLYRCFLGPVTIPGVSSERRAQIPFLCFISSQTGFS